MARRLVRGLAPAWSPDGRWIAFIGQDNRLSVVRASGGRVRRVGGVMGRTVDWQPLPAKQPAACLTPPGSTVLASSDTAIVRMDTLGLGYGEQSWAAMGCLRADGRERVLDSRVSNRGSPVVSGAVLGGTFAALEFEPYGLSVNCVLGITVYNLQTGKGSDVYDNSGASCPSIDPLLLGANGFAAWRVTEQTLVSYSPDDVACPTTSLCVAVDGQGDAVTSTDPTGGPSAWTIALITGADGLNGLACPSVSLCVAVGGQTVATSTDPTGGSGAWTAFSLGAGSVSDVSCPSASLCVAVGSTYSTSTGITTGTIATSTDPTGGPGAWTITSLPRHALKGVSCPSVSLCVAVDNGGSDVLTSTDPTGGAGAWNTVTLSISGPESRFFGVSSVSCPSTTLCVATGGDGDVVTSTNPTGGAAAWTAVLLPGPFPPFPTGVSCPSTSLCFVSGSGGIATSTNPTGGSSAWTTVQPPSVSRISCPSVALCVGVGGGGVLTSTNPTGGAGAWNFVAVDVPPHCAPCIAEQLYAHDNQGTRIVDSAPSGSGTVIGNVQLTGDELTWTHDGTPHEITLH
jgi:hypothetical protein